MSPAIRTTLAAVASSALLAAAAGAQSAPALARADSGPHFALFGGNVGYNLSDHRGKELGASGDFRWGRLPVPLRLSVAFSEYDQALAVSPVSRGSASLELVMRPIPKLGLIQPYFLGGLGVATSAAYRGVYQSVVVGPDGVTPGAYQTFDRPRSTWTFLSLGAGVDVGRAFVQVRGGHPVASNGPNLWSVSAGFRFWD